MNRDRLYERLDDAIERGEITEAEARAEMREAEWEAAHETSLDPVDFAHDDEAANVMGSAPGPEPDETCPNGCVRYGEWWVPEDCPEHLGGV